MRWDDLNMGDKSRMIKLAVDSGITDLRTIRDVYNSYAEGGHLFWPGGPMNLTPYIPKVIAEGYGALKDVLSGNTKKQEKVVEKYHENADKMPAWVHRVVYDTLKDTAFSGNMGDIPINFIHNAFSSRPNIDNTFLLDSERQKQELEKLGFHQVDTSKGYGLVNSAVKKYKDATGREVPMYQIGEDDELRENLIPLNNKYLYNTAENYREVIDAVDPETGMVNKSHREYLGAGMGDVASVPTRYYRDAAGNLYTKEWDFFDHGNYSRRNYNSDEQTYVTKALNTMSNTYGNLMDIAGNPFVRTTGYTRIHPDALKSALPYIVGINNYYDRFKESPEEILKAIKNGEFDIKANGGHLFETGGFTEEDFVGPPAPYIPSDSIKNYIKSTEAFRDKWYKDGNGIDTVGYGFTGDKVKELYSNGMTREQADAYFDTLVSKFARRMEELTPNIDKLTQNQKDALFSYFYNIGEGTYSKKSPKMQKALQDMDWDTVVQNIDAGYNDKKNPGLRKRRDYERALFEMDIPRPLQPIPPAVNREPLYNPTISRFNTTIPFKNGKKEVFNPFMFNLKP